MSLSKVGAGVSLLCAVHCAALPLVAGAAALPGGHWLELGMVGAAAVIGYATLGSSYFQHRRPLPLGTLTAGLGTLGFAHFLAPEHWEALTAVTGALLLVGAQVLNHRHHRVHQCPAPCCAGHTSDTGAGMNTAAPETPFQQA
jgi:hypothetical protein